MDPQKLAEIQARAKARAEMERVKEAKVEQDEAAKPGLLDKIVQGAVNNSGAGPLGVLVGGGNAIAEESAKLLEHGANKAGGVVTDLAASAGASPEVAGGAGYLTNVGIQAIPVLAGGKSTSGLSAPIQSTAKSLMQSAIKPTLKQLKSGDAARAIDTMLKRGYNATEGGMARLKTQIEKLNTEIADAIKNSPATVDKGEVGKALLQTFEKFKNQVNPKSDLDTIKKAWMEFRNHPDLAGKTQIPVQKAQELKQGTYKQLSKKYGQLSAADDEAQKAIARGLKDQIAAKVPGIKNLNAEESELINTLNVAERRVLMGLNNNPAGLSLLAGNKAAAAAFMADKSALFKSLAARMIYGTSEPLATGVGAGAGGVASGATQN